MKKQILGVVISAAMLGSIFVPAISAAAAGERVLKAGVVGADVKQVQGTLQNMGYAVDEIDGVYGKKTQLAVQKFQANVGIKADGVVGKETVNALAKNDQPAGADQTTKQAKSTPQQYSRVLDIVATAYAPGYEDNGPWGNLTHIGTQVRPGIIAVDPKLIPLGSKVYIEFADGHGVYAVAEDTGGAIKGKRIDIAFADRAEAKRFGIQNVKVYVINEGKTRSH
jgi:3D (Asp-Asp-Asp) domain-containing protein